MFAALCFWLCLWADGPAKVGTEGAKAVASASAASPTAALERSIFEFARIQDPLSGLLAVVGLIAILGFTWWLYVRDSVEIHPLVALVLGGLRTAALLGLFWVYLDPQWRIEREIQEDSRVVVLVDTSTSMGMPAEEMGSVAAGPSRTEKTLAALREQKLIEKLRQSHNVLLARFDSDRQTINLLDRIRPEDTTPGGAKRPGPRPLKSEPEQEIGWDKLQPLGIETRIGAALRDSVQENRTTPLAGVILFTDGQQNVGVEPETAIRVAQDAKIPFFPVGLGSPKSPINARIADLAAPARVQKGDDFGVTGFLSGQGLAGKTVNVELSTRPAGAKRGSNEKSEGSMPVVLGADGEVVTVKFELPSEELGRRTVVLRLRAPEGDLDPNDNEQELDVEVVDRKTRILLLAGGPGREYQFLRNQLFRDSSVELDVLLQSAIDPKTGALKNAVSQEANELLEDFPEDPAALADYDCVIAFDPDWRQFKGKQIDALESWVAEQSGGLVVVAGPVFTEDWSQAGGMEKIRAMYPVEFHKKFALLDSGRFQNTEAWPIELTREGYEAEFLWFKEDALSSRQAWSGWEGVFGYYSVRGPKAGATVYGRFSDPKASDGDSQPVYLAGQFYGSGRVFYMGSGEFWRTRAMDPVYFERVYTRLVRFVSQGRLARGSKRGVLLVERDRYLLGDTVSVKAQLYDSAMKPLADDTVPMDVIARDGGLTRVNMQADRTGRPGTYSGQFAVRQEGAFRLELQVPGSGDEERLSKRIHVRVPELEREHPQRNDALLTELAQRTNGRYFVGTDSLDDLVKLLPAQPRVLTESDVPKPVWSNWPTLMLLCAVLCFEWLFRKLAKLA